jgi:hypothetical protein
LSTFPKQINDAVVRNLRRVSHVNLSVNFKNKQYCGCCQLKYFPLLYSKCQSSIIVYLPIGQTISRADHKTSKNKQKTEYMIVGSRQWLCNIIQCVPQKSTLYRKYPIVIRVLFFGTHSRWSKKWTGSTIKRVIKTLDIIIQNVPKNQTIEITYC